MTSLVHHRLLRWLLEPLKVFEVSPCLPRRIPRCTMRYLYPMVLMRYFLDIILQDHRWLWSTTSDTPRDRDSVDVRGRVDLMTEYEEVLVFSTSICDHLAFVGVDCLSDSVGWHCIRSTRIVWL